MLVNPDLSRGARMTDTSTRIAIVGGGLGGLLGAVRLQQQGVREHVLFEARERLGGRILTVGADGTFADPTLAATERFDLGPGCVRTGEAARRIGQARGDRERAFPGYLAGAVDAVIEGVRDAVARLG
jgi:monoamine oxidase